MLAHTKPLAVSIEDAYKALEVSGELNPRKAQHELSLAVAACFSGPDPLIAEAPTGTGKTIAYLVGSIVSALSSNTPVVISTATKALQQQLISNDLPKLYKAGLLTEEDVALAKGKGNYLCVQGAEEALLELRQATLDSEAFIDDNLLLAGAPEIEQAVTLYQKGDWLGDFDLLPTALGPHAKRAIAVNSDTCTGKKCPSYKDCAYLKARNKLIGRKVIIANHDLLLMDLMAEKAEQAPSFPVSSYYLVVDEAHHLPQKAIQCGVTQASLSYLLLNLPKLQGAQTLISGSEELAKFLKSKHVEASMLEKTPLTMATRSLVFALDDIEVDDSFNFRFKAGIVPPDLLALMATVVDECAPLELAFTGTLSALKDQSILPVGLQIRAKELQRRITELKKLISAVRECLAAFRDSTDCAKWLFKKDSTITLHCSPLEGGPQIKALIWEASRVINAVFVSATLRDTEGFGRFKSKILAPSNTLVMTLPHTFAYAECALTIKDMSFTPKFEDRKEFIAELREKLVKSIDPSEGSLVLLPSWAMLREVVPHLLTAFGPQTLRVQGDYPVRLLLDDHRKRIDEGNGSVLVGVATMAEGLDLPGAYCTHVLIASIPFASPSSPVETELSDRLGREYFAQRSLPDAMTRLIQMVGRLLRRESDRGRVTIFDARLSRTAYGRQMLRALPPFKVLTS